MTKVLTSAPILQKQKNDYIYRVKRLGEQGCRPKLVIFLVGEDKASKIYISNKKKLAEEINALCDIQILPTNITPNDFYSALLKSAQDESVNGILVQLPLPKHLQKLDLHQIIPPEKDVDCTSYYWLGKLMADGVKSPILPCTPLGISKLLNFYGITVESKTVAIIGRSLIVGRPLASLLTSLHSTVTLCHSKTRNLQEITRNSHIIVTALGKAKFLTQDFINPSLSSVIIDVGINPLGGKRICGDADYAQIYPLVGAITPVPGGIGPLTVSSLADNLLTLSERRVFGDRPLSS